MKMAQIALLVTRSLGALRAPTSCWRPLGPFEYVLQPLCALQLCDPRRCIHGAFVHDAGICFMYAGRRYV